MRRWLALILLCLLPFQASWATVANYCQHEEVGGIAHFGHHSEEHQHFADDGDHGVPGDQDHDSDGPGPGHHHDHLSGFLGLTGSAVSIALPTWPPALPAEARIPRSTPPEQPERPNWRLPA
jgi:hypothetical protein